MKNQFFKSTALRFIIALSVLFSSCSMMKLFNNYDRDEKVDSLYLPSLEINDSLFLITLDSIIDFSEKSVSNDFFKKGYIGISCIPLELKIGMLSVDISELKDLFNLYMTPESQVLDYIMGAFYYKNVLFIVYNCKENQSLPFSVSNKLVLLTDTDNVYDCQYNIGDIYYINNEYKIAYDFYRVYISW